MDFTSLEIEKMGTSAEIDERIAEVQAVMERLLARREVVAQEERARMERR